MREARQADIRDREKSLINVIRIIERKTILVFLTKNSVLLLLLALAALFVMSDTACSDTYRIHAPKKEDLAFQEWMPEGRSFSVLVPSEWKRRETDLMREHDQYRVTMYVPPKGFDGLVYLSRVGFNSAKNTALFYVEWSGSLRTGYFVLMDKEDNKWVLKNAVMDSMIIY